MNFNQHCNLVGAHAFLGASQYHWLNYDEAKVAERYTTMMAAQKGTELHDFAATCIKLGQKLPKSRKTLNRCYIIQTTVLELPMQFASEMIFFEFMI